MKVLEPPVQKKTEPSTQLQASKLIRLNTRMITNIYWKKQDGRQGWNLLK